MKESNFEKLLYKNKLNLPTTPRKIQEDLEEKFLFVFVMDEAYPLKINYLKPFARRQFNNMKRIYCYRQCAFSILTKRFNIFENKMLIHPNKLLL